MKFIRYYSVIFFLLGSVKVYSQSKEEIITVTGRVTDDKKMGVPGANIRLRHLVDSTFIKYAESDSIGNYSLKNLKSGNYQIQVSYIGFSNYEQQLSLNISNTTVELPTISLLQGANTLATVTVSTNRPFIEQQLDRTVLNVESAATSAGVSTLEVLEKAPGVSIDQNGSIKMRGKQGVVVMINDKPVQLSGTELTELLRSLSASNVDKLELITNPPAKYDAAGISGIINIKMKKSARRGVNGNISLNGGHGKYVKSFNGGNISYNANKINLYGNYNYAYRGDFVLMDIARKFSAPNQEISDFIQDYDQDIIYGAHTARTGVDYKLAKQSTIGAEFFGNFVAIDRTTNSLSSFYNNPNATDGKQTAYNTTINGRNNYGVNLNFDQKLDTAGTSLTFDLDYAAYILDDKQTYDIRFQNMDQSQSQIPSNLYNDSQGKLHIQSAGINYLKNFDAVKFEGGVKASAIKSVAKLDFYDKSNGIAVYDQNLSNQFQYKENIQSAYLNAATKKELFQFQAGLRLEATQASGIKLGAVSGFNRKYMQLFPSAAVNYNVSKNHTIGLAMSRRISRPTYGQVNPYFYFLDLSTRFSGNPELLPSLSYATDINYLYKSKYILSFGYFNTKNPIVDTQLTATTDPKIIIQQPINLDRYEVFSLNMTIPFRISSWFSSNNNLGAYHGIYKGTIQNSAFNVSKPYFTINTSNTFMLKDWSLQIVGTYNGKQYFGNSEIDPVKTFAVALQRKLMAKNASIGLNFSDVFWGNVVRSTNAIPGYSNQLFWRRDSRTIALNFSYRFGGKNQATERKKGSAEEEKRRAG